MSYTPPGTELYQTYAPTLVEAPQPQLPCIVGPRYDFFDILDPDDKAQIYAGLYDPTAGNTVAYPSKHASSNVDLPSVKVFFENLEAEYFSKTAATGNYEFQVVTGVLNKITTTGTGVLSFADYTNSNGDEFERSEVFNSRDVKVGDKVKITGVIDEETETHTSIIRALEHEEVDPIIGSVATGEANQGALSEIIAAAVAGIGNTGDDTAVSSGTYLGNLRYNVTDDVYTITVILGGAPATAKLQISTTSGTDEVAEQVFAAFGAPFTVGTKGVSLAITDGGNGTLALGDTWTVACTMEFEPVEAEVAGDYEGDQNTTYFIRVVQGGTFNSDDPPVIVVTSSGYDSSGPTDIVDSEIAYDIGTKGLTVEFAANAQDGLIEGDTWSVEVTAATLGAVKTLVLTSTIPQVFLDNPATELSVQLYLVKSSLEIPRYKVDDAGVRAWEESAASVVIEEALNITDATWFDDDGLLPIPVKYAKMYLEYRALRYDKTDKMYSILSIDEVEEVLGKIDYRNPLAYGVYLAALAMGGSIVTYLGVSVDSTAGYTAALQKLETEDSIYTLVILDYSPTIHALAKAHVLAMSQPTVKKWRIAFVCKQLDLYTWVYKLYETEDYLATITQDPEDEEGYLLVQASQEQDIDFTTNVEAGQIFRANFTTNLQGEIVYSDYVIAEVVSSTVLKLETGPVTPVEIPSKFEILYSQTKLQQAQQLAAYGTSLGSHRVYCTWPDELGIGETTVPGYFVGAYIAGQIAKNPAHQGLTNSELTLFDSVTKSSGYFTEVQLNLIAEGGIWIVDQDSSGKVFHRHQLSTDMTLLQTRELSVVKNADSISKFFIEQTKDMIGKWNVSNELLETVFTVRLSSAETLKANTYPKIGAQLGPDTVLGFPTKDPVFKDRVHERHLLDMPSPLGRLVIVIEF